MKFTSTFFAVSAACTGFSLNAAAQKNASFKQDKNFLQTIGINFKDAINLKFGYLTIDIRTPKEVTYEDRD